MFESIVVSSFFLWFAAFIVSVYVHHESKKETVYVVHNLTKQQPAVSVLNL